MAGLTEADMDLSARAPLFAGLDRADLDALLRGAQAVSYARTELLFNEGDRADRFFVILAGGVSLFALTESGDHTIIEAFDAVNSFAEAAMFSSGRFPLNCEVAAGSRLIHVPAASFLKRLSDDRRLALRLLAGLASWQQRLIREISDLKSKTPLERLASFLIAMAPPAEAGARIQLPLSKASLASRIGITPESLSRALARLKAVGVESRGRNVVITDLDALRRLVRDAGQ